MRLLVLVLLCCFLGLSCASFPYFEPSKVDLEGLVKIRCSLDQKDETLFAFNGTVYAYPTNPQQFPKLLFKTVGLNLGRCFKRAEGNYTLVSREFLYYIDPVTDRILNSWTNPYTGQTVTVMHVDNDPVLQTFQPGTTYPVSIEGDETTLPLDVPLMYPNPLYFNPTLRPYSPLPNYQAGELFKFTAPSKDVFNTRLKTVSSVSVTWTRIGPWLPWMNMGEFSGYLAYSSYGARVPDWTQLPDQVRQDVATRVQRYQHAPTCLPAPTVRSVTSWTFFANNLNNYLAGVQFPLAIPQPWPCNSTEPSSTPTEKPTRKPTPRGSSTPRHKLFIRDTNESSSTTTIYQTINAFCLALPLLCFFFRFL